MDIIHTKKEDSRTKSTFIFQVSKKVKYSNMCKNALQIGKGGLIWIKYYLFISLNLPLIVLAKLIV